MLYLPDGIDRYDISDKPFILEPAGVEASWQRISGTGSRARVFMSFDKDDVVDALQDMGRVELAIVGKLESGQCVYGTNTIRIIQPRRHLLRRRR